MVGTSNQSVPEMAIEGGPGFSSVDSVDLSLGEVWLRTVDGNYIMLNLVTLW